MSGGKTTLVWDGVCPGPSITKLLMHLPMAKSGGEQWFKVLLPEGVPFNVHCSESPIHCCYVKPPAGVEALASV